MEIFRMVYFWGKKTFGKFFGHSWQHWFGLEILLVFNVCHFLSFLQNYICILFFHLKKCEFLEKLNSQYPNHLHILKILPTM